MSDKPADTTAAYQVELVIRQLDSLSMLPCVAARVFSQPLESKSSLSALAEIIESDPALAAKIFSLTRRWAVSLPDEKPSIRRAIDKLPAHVVRDAVFSVKVYQPFGQNEDRVTLSKQLVQHSLAVACCAKDIAGILSPGMDSQLAYFAGLLHDIGKLALEEAMPKSFARIVEEAKSQAVSCCAIEQKHLGTDHTILGKRVAQKWHLPERITLAVWLHHSDTDIISQDMPEARIAQIVQAADLLARQCGIGSSGSFDSPDLPEKTSQRLGITDEQLEQIRRALPEAVERKSKILGLDRPNAAKDYCDVVHATAGRLAKKHTKLSLENRRLQTASSHLDFITEFLLSINSADRAVDIAENFAAGWQRFYQTGTVCLYLIPPADSQKVEAVIVENLSQSRIVSLNVPPDSASVPEAIANDFAILNAHEHIGWLFEQLDVEFDLSQTKLLPLLSAGKAIGAIAFEVRYPADTELFLEDFKASASTAGAVLNMASLGQRQQDFAERFAQLLAKCRDTRGKIAEEAGPKHRRGEPAATAPLASLAEMSAGAAHELNNPLLVISGRAELLAKAETDSEKKRILEQIQQNTSQISQIVDDLMAFAEPKQPSPATTDIKQIIEEATQLAARKCNLEHIDIRTNIADGAKSVFADPVQIVSAIANVICNSLESYTGEPGPIKVTAKADESGDFVKLQISDLGCGMDEDILQKATQPFFSAKPAGRKRGMGLAHAARLIELNNGSLNITSRPGEGTTVTISLPCK